MVCARWAVVQCRFEGFHRYPAAPAEVAFLRALHRHEFHVKLEVEQFNNDRDVEFILLKRWLETRIKEQQMEEQSSCEDIATRIYDGVAARFPGRKVRISVFEDGENGAMLEFAT